MLKDHEAPTGFDSENKNPLLTREQKLAIIAIKPVMAADLTDTMSVVTLPFTAGAEFTHGIFDDPDLIYNQFINVGDKELYKAKIGTRLLGAGVRHLLEKNAKLNLYKSSEALLGVLNTAINVFGEDNVATTKRGIRYGWQADQPLAAMFDDVPFEPGSRYFAGYVEARIDPERATEWELPVVKQYSELQAEMRAYEQVETVLKNER